jgi:large subunit ribosomal protein L25
MNPHTKDSLSTAIKEEKFLNTIELNVTTRTTTGNGPARVLRRDGRVPAILYGPRAENIMLSVSAHDLDKILKHGSVGRTIFNLKIDEGQDTRAAMIKEMQIHPVSRAFLHLDLYEISMDRKIHVNVPVVTTGKAQGVELGGVLQLVFRELEVLCFPNDIPDAISIDITELGVGDAVHVEDIQLPGKAEIPHDTNFTVLTITSPKSEAAEGEKAEGEEADEAAPAGGSE